MRDLIQLIFIPPETDDRLSDAAGVAGLCGILSWLLMCVAVRVRGKTGRERRKKEKQL